AAAFGRAAARGRPPQTVLRDILWVGAPAAGFFLLACASKTQIGYRHILPVYPFLVVLGGCGGAWLWRLGWKRGRPAALALAAWLPVSVARAHPHYLAYFNELTGGPAEGYRALIDSNLDWGQGLKPLARSLAAMGNPPIYLSYFGVADPSYFGIRYLPVATVSNAERREGVVPPGDGDPVLLAVSATNLQAAYFADHSLFDWLKPLRPRLVAGHSIFLYDLTDDPDAALRLAELAQASGQTQAAARLRRRYAGTVRPPAASR
ncbi:MAG: hypothetical protein PHF00_07530, partial [Elusimicrobia bacterium]|nr:hypothetical protein [Elusimicrobiota bacterium]